MKIGQLAAATGTQVETIRYYERQSLLPQAVRTEANYRIYDASHVQRLAFIRHCRCLDMTLDEIRVLLHYKDSPGDNCGEVNALLDEHIGHVVTRIRELKTLEKDLRGLRSGCAADSTAADCGILDGLERASRAHDHAVPAGAQRHHIAGPHASRPSVAAARQAETMSHRR
jgi:Cd(II)/Pb(II)-responsive transcriptional regulator